MRSCRGDSGSDITCAVEIRLEGSNVNTAVETGPTLLLLGYGSV